MFRAGKAGSSCLAVNSSVLLSGEAAAQLWGWQRLEVSRCQWWEGSSREEEGLEMFGTGIARCACTGGDMERVWACSDE